MWKQKRTLSYFLLRGGRREAAASQSSLIDYAWTSRVLCVVSRHQRPAMAPQNSLVSQSAPGKQPMFPISPGRAWTLAESETAHVQSAQSRDVRLCLQITLWAMVQIVCEIKVNWVGAHKGQTGQWHLWGCQCGPHNPRLDIQPASTVIIKTEQKTNKQKTTPEL